MSKKRVAINGFGRIGRLTFRQLITSDEVEVVAINDLSDPAMLAHLLKYDTAHGRFEGTVSVHTDHIVVNGKRIEVLALRDPVELPWASMHVDIVLECTGIFRKREQANKHIQAGAKRVIISAPAKSDDVPTVVIGINEDTITAEDTIVSNASCTTNCLAPIVKVIVDNWGWESAVMTTTHAYTGAQNIHDGPNKDWRRARAAAQNIVPTTTGSAQAVGLVIPEVADTMIAMAVRVPVITGSMIELSVVTQKDVDVASVNRIFKEAAADKFQNILQYEEDPIVSSDVIGSRYSTIFDSLLTRTMGSRHLRVVAWYDNENGYSSRLVDLVHLM